MARCRRTCALRLASATAWCGSRSGSRRPTISSPTSRRRSPEYRGAPGWAALPFQDAFERPVEGEDDDAREGDEARQHQEEAHLVHRAPEAAEPAGEEIAGEAGRQP